MTARSELAALLAPPSAADGEAARGEQPRPQEVANTLTGADRLWWRCCQEAAVQGDHDWLTGRVASESLQIIAEKTIGDRDERRAVVAASTMTWHVARALCASPDDLPTPGLEDAVAYWSAAHMLPPRPSGAGLVERARLPALAGGVRHRCDAVLDALATIGDNEAARAMTALTALLLVGAGPRRRPVSQMSVVFGVPGAEEMERGAAGTLEVRELPGGPAGLFPDPRTLGGTRGDSAFVRALRIAWDGSPGRLGGRCILWSLALDDADLASIEGPSLGAAFSLTLREILLRPTSRRPSVAWMRYLFQRLYNGPRPRTAITGDVDEDGNVKKVGDVGPKLLAAYAKKWRLVAPEANSGDIGEAPDPDAVDFVASLREARKRMRRWRAGRVAVSFTMLIVVAAAMTGFGLYSAQRSSAQVERDLAISRRLSAQSASLLNKDPAAAFSLAGAAWRISRTSEARYAMVNAMAQPARYVFAGHQSGVGGLSFSRDGRLLASASSDSVRVWDMVAHRQVGPPISVPERSITAVAFSPDGRYLATGDGVGGETARGDEGSIRLWDIRTHRQLARLDPHAKVVRSVAFSPDGKVLVSADDTTIVRPVGVSRSAIRVWNTTTFQQMGRLRLPSDPVVQAVAISPDGNTLASSGLGDPIRLWDIHTLHQLGAAFDPTSQGAVSITFSPDGRLLAGADEGGGVRQWKVSTRSPLGVSMKVAGSTGLTQPVIAFSADSGTLATGGLGPTGSGVQLWDSKTRQQTGDELTGHAGAVLALAFSPDGSTLASGSADHTVRLWDASVYRRKASIATGHQEDVSDLAFTPDGKVLITSSSDGSAFFAHVAQDQVVPGQITGDFGQMTSVMLSPDGSLLVTGDGPGGDTGAGEAGSVQLWDTASLRQYGPTLTGHTHGVIDVAISPDKKYVAGASYDGVRIWDVQRHRELGGPVAASGNGACSVIFSPDGKSFATGGSDGTVRLWNLADRTQIGQALVGHTANVCSMAFSKDGRLLVTGGYDGRVRFWNPSTQQQTGDPINVSKGIVTSVAISPDGTEVATASSDETARVWDIATRKEIGPSLSRSGGSSTVEYSRNNAAVFSPDGNTLATAGYDGSAQLWSVGRPRDLLAALCRIAGDFNRQEWKKKIPDHEFVDVCP